MMHDDVPAYGLWMLVVLNSLVFIIFAFSFGKPRSPRDWRSFGAFSAFIVALFTEMYGFPLTIYLLSGWLQTRYPGIDLMSHDAGHLWPTLFGLKGDPHFGVLHLLSTVVIIAGFFLLGAAWRVLYAAQKEGRLAVSGPYAHVRHPQYVGFILVMLGFLLQWPTLLTLLMFPLLVGMYVHLAHTEEREVRQIFGPVYDAYAADMPAWFPRLRGSKDNQRVHAARMARMQFAALIHDRTRDETGILLFVSLAEHHVEIVPDKGITDRIDQGEWKRIVDSLLPEVRAGRLAPALTGAVSACVAVLEGSFPPQANPRNQLADRVTEA